MEKLIELLNEYEGKKTYKEYMDYQINEELPYKLDSLKVLKGFIKRLVENDKIDLLRLDNRIALSEFNKVERVLMALSISDEPIDFLCEILK